MPLFFSEIEASRETCSKTVQFSMTATIVPIRPQSDSKKAILAAKMALRWFERGSEWTKINALWYNVGRWRLLVTEKRGRRQWRQPINYFSNHFFCAKEVFFPDQRGSEFEGDGNRNTRACSV